MYFCLLLFVFLFESLSSYFICFLRKLQRNIFLKIRKISEKNFPAHSNTSALLFTRCANSNGFCRCSAFQIGKICYHNYIIRHFQFRKCLPVYSNTSALFLFSNSLNFLLRLSPKSSIMRITQSGFRDSCLFTFFSYSSF